MFYVMRRIFRSLQGYISLLSITNIAFLIERKLLICEKYKSFPGSVLWIL